jgi:NAD(P)-dependent dehydrogenase (short-subunit alcohol dehydrogenase family)
MGEEGRQTDTGIKVPKWRFMDYILGKLDFCFWLQTAFRILRSYSSLAGVPSFPILVCSPMIAMLAPDDFSGEAGMFDLELGGRVAIVTGGSDGLGRATARRLAAEGCKVVICARRQDYLQAAAAALAEETGGTVVAQAADVTRPADIEALVAATLERFGGIDILVNNAGSSAAAALEDLDDAAWHADIELKLMAAVRLCRAIVPLMRQRGGGAIVNATIPGGKAPTARSLPTSVTRAAGINLTKSLANEFAADGIRVNTVCIGLIKSAQWERRAGDKPVDELYAQMAERVPLGHVGEAADYADLVAFLVSQRARYITGTAVNLDGGMSPVV